MLKDVENSLLFLHKKYGITPDVLTYIRIFAAPWLALLISKILNNKSFTLAIITIILYFLVVITDALDGILARALSKNGKHDHAHGGMLDRLSDKILIIFLLIPFGLNLYTFLIILAESLLAFQAIFSPDNKKQAVLAGKIKMFLQSFLIPILILKTVTFIVPEMFLYGYIILTIIFSYISVYFHYFYFSND